MSLQKYFQLANRLPKPDSPLSTAAPSSTIAAVREEVKQLLDKADNLQRMDRLSKDEFDL